MGERNTHPMSKRLRVIISDDEYRAVQLAARREGKTVSRVVREALRRVVTGQAEPTSEDRIAAVLRFARFAGPTGDIDTILSDVDRGRGLA